MIGWHHQLDGHEFEEAPGVGDGQGSLGFMLQSMGSQRIRQDSVTEQQRQPADVKIKHIFLGFLDSE